MEIGGWKRFQKVGLQPDQDRLKPVLLVAGISWGLLRGAAYFPAEGGQTAARLGGSASLAGQAGGIARGVAIPTDTSRLI